MMKYIVLVGVCLAGTAAVLLRAAPADAAWYVERAEAVALRGWAAIVANPFPAAVAAGTFLLTVLYHKAKGKSFRESVEVAATRVTVVNVPPSAGAESAIVQRAKARATRTQLIADQIGLQNRARKLPDAVVKAEQETCYAEKALADAEKQLADKRKAHDEAVDRLESLRREMRQGEAEIAAIDVELKRLAEVV